MTQEEFFKRYTYSPSRDRIGGGGFGTVYKAYDIVLHREVAIKVSEVKTTADGKKTFSLKDEFEALNHVPKHPNIANYEEFYSYESPQGIFDYAVMQYYPDGNLSNAIKQGLSVDQKEDIATQLLEGIDFLHKHKVVHRDLKPGNILIVRHAGRMIPLITDFGLSKATGMGENSVFSNSFGAGTPKYSSPEQLQGKPLRFNTDLWSYGAILYELFTGEQLFSAGSGAANSAQADMEIYNKIVNGNVKSLGGMPEKWRRVAERCLVVDAAKRAKDAVELFTIIKGDDDETEIGGPSTPLTSSRTEGSGTATGHGTPNTTPPTDKPSPKDSHSGLDPLSPTPNDKPKTKKALWIGLGIVAVAVVALLLLLKPKQEPMINPDTQAYKACQTVADYRAYLSDYGRNALHYADAKAFIDQYLADSIEQARKAQALANAAQKEEAERQAQAKAEKEEDAAYKKCTTIAACESYLKTYPQGRYVAEVRKKKAELEAENEAKTKVEYTTRVNGKLYTSSEYPDVVYYFGKDSHDVRKMKTTNKRAKEELEKLLYDLQTNRQRKYTVCDNGGSPVWTITIDLVGTVTPGESYSLAADRLTAVQKDIVNIMMKMSNVDNFHVSFNLRSAGVDFQGLVTMIQASNISGKEQIVYQIQNASDKEQAINEMVVLYPELERDILPLLRHVKVYCGARDECP